MKQTQLVVRNAFREKKNHRSKQSPRLSSFAIVMCYLYVFTEIAVAFALTDSIAITGFEVH